MEKKLSKKDTFWMGVTASVGFGMGAVMVFMVILTFFGVLGGLSWLMY